MNPPSFTFYVSVLRDGKQRSILSGPYATNDDAMAQIDHAFALACHLDEWCAFDAFGTCSIENGKATGVLQRNGFPLDLRKVPVDPIGLRAWMANNIGREASRA